MSDTSVVCAHCNAILKWFYYELHIMLRNHIANPFSGTSSLHENIIWRAQPSSTRRMLWSAQHSRRVTLSYIFLAFIHSQFRVRNATSVLRFQCPRSPCSMKFSHKIQKRTKTNLSSFFTSIVFIVQTILTQSSGLSGRPITCKKV